jgi:hypothetical protein
MAVTAPVAVPKPVRVAKKEVTCTCSECGQKGHRANNRSKCPFTAIKDDWDKRFQAALDAQQAALGLDRYSDELADAARPLYAIWIAERQSLVREFKASLAAKK